MRIMRVLGGPIAAAVAGAVLALGVHGLRTPLSITVDSAEPGTAFAVITDGALPGGGKAFETPMTFRFDGQERIFAIGAIDPEVPLTVSTRRRSLTGTRASSSSGDGFHLVELGPHAVRWKGVGFGALELALFEMGGAYTGIQFGEGVECVAPEVWSLAVQEDLRGARARCLELSRTGG